jgi:3-hydroxyisobutyrate dehydrogenase-like beta-hydroxyacid dehydrogenase
MLFDPHSAPAGTPDVQASEQIGLVGIGLMGSALAERLAAGRLRVAGFDINPGRCQVLTELGGEPLPDARAVAAACDRILLSLPDSTVVEQVLEQMRDQLRPGQVIVDTGTGAPGPAIALGARLARAGVAYLDATISGSSAQVRSGEVTLMVGGTDAAFRKCRDMFGLFARRVFHVGACGSGSTIKLVSNLILGLNRAALAEGLAFAKALGLDPAQSLEVLRESMAYSRIMDTKGDKMVNGDFEAHAKLSQHLKDVRLILEAGAEAGAELPLTRTHRQLLDAAEEAGLGHLDNSAIIRVFVNGAAPAVRTARDDGDEGGNVDAAPPPTASPTRP